MLLNLCLDELTHYSLHSFFSDQNQPQDHRFFSSFFMLIDKLLEVVFLSALSILDSVSLLWILVLPPPWVG